MQRITHGDLVALARVLYETPRAERAELCQTAFDGAQEADAFRRRQGRVHPTLGDGSLTGWAGQRPRPSHPEPPLDTPDYVACLTQVLTCAVERRAGRAKSRLSGRLDGELTNLTKLVRL